MVHKPIHTPGIPFIHLKCLAIDLVQEHVLKAGDQSNESAVEQAKDTQIASAIRTGYKTFTGKDFPIPEKSS